MPQRKDDTERVLGPYEEKRNNIIVGYRIIHLRPGFPRSVSSFPTEARAKQEKASIEGGLALQRTRTIGDTIADYLESCQVQEETRTTYRFVLNQILPKPRSLLRALTPAGAKDCYSLLTTRVAVATHHYALRVVHLWAAHCIEKGWLQADPYASITPVGTPERGKPQPTLDEARRLYAVCLEEASEASVAVLCLLLLGLRGKELLRLSARALDDGGKILRVFRGKTRAAARPLCIPVEIRPLLAELAAARPLRIFPHHHPWLRYHLRRLVDLAGIPIELSPHSLRGAFATFAIDSGAATQQVAQLLGHGNTQVGRRHYIAGGAVEAAQVVRLAEAMRSASVPQKGE